MKREELIQLLTKATEIRLNNLQDVQTLILAEEYEEEIAEKKAINRMLKQRNDALKNKREEMEKLHNVMQLMQEETYYYSIAGRYLENETDEAIAEKIHCDVTTVRRNRKKLLQKMAFALYEIHEDEYAYEKM